MYISLQNSDLFPALLYENNLRFRLGVCCLRPQNKKLACVLEGSHFLWEGYCFSWEGTTRQTSVDSGDLNPFISNNIFKNRHWHKAVERKSRCRFIFRSLMNKPKGPVGKKSPADTSFCKTKETIRGTKLKREPVLDLGDPEWCDYKLLQYSHGER